MHEENKLVSPPKPPAINRQLWLRFLTIARPYGVSEHRWLLWTGLGLLVVLLVLQTVSSVMFNRESGECISALADLLVDLTGLQHELLEIKLSKLFRAGSTLNVQRSLPIIQALTQKRKLTFRGK